MIGFIWWMCKFLCGIVLIFSVPFAVMSVCFAIIRTVRRGSTAVIRNLGDAAAYGVNSLIDNKTAMTVEKANAKREAARDERRKAKARLNKAIEESRLYEQYRE